MGINDALCSISSYRIFGYVFVVIFRLLLFMFIIIFIYMYILHSFSQ